MVDRIENESNVDRWRPGVEKIAQMRQKTGSSKPLAGTRQNATMKAKD
jgi:hypothetical protein